MFSRRFHTSLSSWENRDAFYKRISDYGREGAESWKTVM